MSEIISKELLNVVLNQDIKDIYGVGANPNFEDNIITYSIKGNGDLEYFNIHELAFKCKEWANRKGNCGLIVKYAPCVTYVYFQFLIGDFSPNPIKADTEPEAIFKACQWILDNKGK